MALELQGGVPTLSQIMRPLRTPTNTATNFTSENGAGQTAVPPPLVAPHSATNFPSEHGQGGGYLPGGTGSAAPGAQTTPDNSPAPPNPSSFTPDYTQLLQNDPIYKQLQLNLSAAGIQAAGTRKAQTDQALAQFGEIPDLTSAINGLGLDPNSPMYQMLFGDIDQPTRDAAQQLTAVGLSTTAGLDRQHATDIQNLLDSMAAHGTVQSGGTGVGLGQADQAYSQNQYSARTSLINYLSGVQQAFNQAQQSAQQQLQQGAEAATQRLISEYPAIGPQTQAATAAAAAPDITGGLGG